MVAIKAADADAFVARPDPARRVVLVFVPDAGLVSERVTAILKASVDDVNDPFALARLEGEELAAEPSRLIEEALTMPLFGGRRAPQQTAYCDNSNRGDRSHRFALSDRAIRRKTGVEPAAPSKRIIAF